MVTAVFRGVERRVRGVRVTNDIGRISTIVSSLVEGLKYQGNKPDFVYGDSPSHR